jgi:hypothetical protein
MAQDWHELTRMTGSRGLIVERVRIEDAGVAIEGEFELPPLARLTADDQLFVAAFVRSHGSIKKMEELFGISYPTVKNRLNRIGGAFDFVEVHLEPETRREEVLARLERGDISIQEALTYLEQGGRDE